MDRSLPKIENVVANAKLDLPKRLLPLNFSQLAHRLPNVKFDPRTSPILPFNVRVLGLVAGGILHSTGSINICGSKSKLMAKKAIKIMARKIGRIYGLEYLHVLNFRVTNVVAHMKVDAPIHIYELLCKHKNSKTLEYDPETNSWVKYKHPSTPSFTAFLFPSGKINLFGIKNEANVGVCQMIIQEMITDCIG